MKKKNQKRAILIFLFSLINLQICCFCCCCVDTLSELELIGLIKREYSGSFAWSSSHRKIARRMPTPESAANNEFADKFERGHPSGTSTCFLFVAILLNTLTH